MISLFVLPSTVKVVHLNKTGLHGDTVGPRVCASVTNYMQEVLWLKQKKKSCPHVEGLETLNTSA